MQASRWTAAYSRFEDRLERWARRLKLALAILLSFGLAGVVVWELRTSGLQAHFLSRYVRTLTYRVEPGASDAIRFPAAGPYDARLGYSRLPDFVERLAAAGYEVKAQARLSTPLMDLADRDIFLPYHEKDQSGLRIRDRRGHTLYEAQNPERIYRRFGNVPPVIVETLLFIENRELLDPRFPQRNPTIEWDRLAKAALEYAYDGESGQRGPGGSSLATQIEKARHSPHGVTGSIAEKFRQMASASLRVYLDGKETLAAQRRIVATYLNSLPLAAVPGYGEVIGLAAGLEHWFGADFDAVNGLLWLPETGSYAAEGTRRAAAYKQVLSLLLAQRRPTFYLIQDQAALVLLTDSYLRLLAQEGVISPGLRDQALAAQVKPRTSLGPLPHEGVQGRKTANVVRSWLVTQLGLSDLYELDRLDLTVRSTLNRTTQERLAEILGGIADAEKLKALGLDGPRMLGQGDPAGVIFSVLLYERGEGVNWLRVQADNLGQAFNVADGAKLDLGSTAKFRTLVTYLDVIAILYGRYANLPPEMLRQTEVYPSDRLTRWVIEHLTQRPESSLMETLEAAMERRYSASPNERFFTGGGVHSFENFDSKHDHQVLSVRQAFHNSVNLVFIRLMRDIVNHYQFQVPGSSAKLLEDVDDPQRHKFLERFADREGRTFLSRFYLKYAGRAPDEALDAVLATVKSSPRRLAATLRFIEPDWTWEEFDGRLRALVTDMAVSKESTQKLYDEYAADRFDLNDRGYITRIHPLELWLVRYLRHDPQATFDQVLEASTAERIAVYRWLFQTRRKKAQDLRIRSLLEIEAFLEIHRAWQRLGYPFDRLVPSYATAIGSSADRPAALARLMGIILNDGMRYPTYRVDELRFAGTTPYETVLGPAQTSGQRVLPAEVARVTKEALIGTVGEGTARRAYGAVQLAGSGGIVVGGKTGTGDHRFKTFGRGANLLEERVVSRSAAFVFFVGDRFFGVVTAYVLGPQAANYKFTSALPVQLFASLVPVLFEDFYELNAPAVPTL